MIPSMRKYGNRKEDSQGKREYRPDFKSILKKASISEATESLECKTVGYTSDAIPYLYIYKVREYHQ